MQNQEKSSIMLTVKDGFLVCPICRQNKKMQEITPDMYALRTPVYCRRCKSRMLVDVINGQCFESRSQ